MKWALLDDLHINMNLVSHFWWKGGYLYVRLVGDEQAYRVLDQNKRLYLAACRSQGIAPVGDVPKTEMEEIKAERDWAFGQLEKLSDRLGLYHDGMVDAIVDLLEKQAAGRLLLLPNLGDVLYFIGSCDCTKCPERDSCPSGCDSCPEYIDSDTWDAPDYKKFDEGSQLWYFLSGRYYQTYEAAAQELERRRNEGK